MTTRRRILLGISGTLVALVVALAAAPFLFRDRIEARLRDAIERSVDAHVAWNGIRVGLFRNFPNVSMTVNELSVAGTGIFAGDTLISAPRIHLALDLGSVVRFIRRGESIVVREIALDRPTATLRVLADGTANWYITRSSPDTAAAADRAIALTLKEFRIDGGRVSLRDEQSGLDLAVSGLHERLRGDFARERFTISSRTTADTVTAHFGGIPLLTRARLELTSDVDADLRARRFTFADDTLRLNDLLLAFGGSVSPRPDETDIDLTFAAPGTSFGEILSLVPAIYARDFAELRTTGSMSVSGRVRGSYGPDAFPSLAIRATVTDGAFQYPSLQLPARDIQAEIAIENPGGHVDSTVVRVDRFHAMIGTRVVDARLAVRTPATDPDVDLRLRGSLDLAELARTVKLEDVDGLAGVVAADVAIRSRLSDADARRYDRVDARGTVNAAGVRAGTRAFGAIAIDTAAMTLTPRAAELATLVATIGKSDIRASGSVDNILGFVLRGDDLRGSGTIASRNFNLDEWISEEPTEETILVPARVDLSLRAAADRVTYGQLVATDVRGGVRIKDQRATLDEFQMDLFGGRIVATGFYETVVAARPAFDFSMRLATLDIPTAFAQAVTVQRLAPIARWAKGTLSGTIGLRGSLDSHMVPDFAALSGAGAFSTGQLMLEGVPLLRALADAISFEPIRNPALGTQKGSFSVADGKVTVHPVSASVGGFELTAGGWHGIDQALGYDLALAIPRTLLVGPATSAVTRLVRQAGRTETDFLAGEVAQLRARVAGTVTDPKVEVDFAGMASSVRDAARTLVTQEIESRIDEVRQAGDTLAEEARRRAREEGARIVAAAESQADTIRAEGRRLAEAAVRAASERADSLVARARDPIAQVAARAAADRARREAQQQADRLVREADARADGLVSRARQQAAALLPPGG